MKASDLLPRIKEANRFRGIDHCKHLKGKQTLQELVALLTTFEGITFIKQTKFPILDVLRDKEVNSVLFNLGIVVDKDVNLSNIPYLLLAGKGHSHLIYDDNSTYYTLVVAHGHKANITAKNGALVSLHNIGGDITIETENLGKVT
jgi:hypothetical protein